MLFLGGVSTWQRNTFKIRRWGFVRGFNYIHLYLAVTQGNWINFLGPILGYAKIHRWSRCINIVACFATYETGVLISCFCMLLILTETVDEDGTSSTDSGEEKAGKRKRTVRPPVHLTPEQSNLTLDYIKTRPYLWNSRLGEFKKMKDEREEAWIELAKKLGISCEYHFFRFIIVSDGDTPT